MYKRYILTHNLSDVLHIFIWIFGRVEDCIHFCFDQCRRGVHTDLHTGFIVFNYVADVLLVLILDSVDCQLPIYHFLDIFAFGCYLNLISALELALISLNFILFQEQKLFQEYKDVVVAFFLCVLISLFTLIYLFPTLMHFAQVYFIPVHYLILQFSKAI